MYLGQKHKSKKRRDKQKRKTTETSGRRTEKHIGFCAI
jgi:hypothetical protein